jgi:Holliday junction DNA helicase RuvB
MITWAREHEKALGHLLLVGQPGFSGRTVAQIIAHDLKVNFRATSAPAIKKAGDIAALLTNLEPRDVLFIDEIHRVKPELAEILLAAMEDFQLDLIIGEGRKAREVKIDLSPFTLIGASVFEDRIPAELRKQIARRVYVEGSEMVAARKARRVSKTG